MLTMIKHFIFQVLALLVVITLQTPAAEDLSLLILMVAYTIAPGLAVTLHVMIGTLLQILIKRLQWAVRMAFKEISSELLLEQ